jgi:hypothetical protein
MKINSTIKFIVILLVMMSGAGTASAYLAFKAGYESLKGVSQPTANPTKKLLNNAKPSNHPKEFIPIDEKTILIKVYDHVNKKEKPDTKKADSDKKNTDKTVNKEAEKKDDLSNKNSEKNTEKLANFPLTIQDGGVTLAVTESKKEGDSLLLSVKLKNEGTETVKFLYSFLEVKDDQGRALSVVTEGLPEELPANKEDFQGTVKIPSILTSKAQTISMNLTDYPKQQLKLNLKEIPVIRENNP